MAAGGTVWDVYDVEQGAGACPGASNHPHNASRFGLGLRYAGQSGHLRRK